MNPKLHILLIEDNPRDVRLIQEMLGNGRMDCSGDKPAFHLICSNRLLAGLKRLDEEPVDLILLDLSLPDSHGFDTFRAVQKQAAHLPIIVLSGLDDESQAVLAVREGAQDYLVKGYVDSNLLTRSIRYAIERKRAEEKIKASLQEKELLLKEIHHRVKNNLQVITSLLHLQSYHIKDPKTLEMFKESQDRVRSMALVHEKLYRSPDLAKIDFAQYIKSLTHGLYRSYSIDPKQIELKSKVEDVFLSIDMAVPCGLIVNELVSNSLKHGFPPQWEGKGRIGIVLRRKGDDQIELIVKDNGIGM
ncbi:response regulator [bacterium]|nr:response regulator [bacterium]